MKKNSEKIEEPKIELSIDAMKELYKEQEKTMRSIMDYKLPNVLDDISNPLTFGEKKSLQKFDLKKIETLDDNDFDELLGELLELRGVDSDTIDLLDYSDLQMWVRKVAISTFNTRIIATKK